MAWFRSVALITLLLPALALTSCKPTVGPPCGDGGGGNECSGQCVDVANDPSNCGACGKSCEPGAVCGNGSCSCPVGEQTCGGACVDVMTDVNNCGGCGMSCAGTGSTCTGGSCEQVVAAQQDSPSALALSSAGVFWINSGNEDVLQSGLTGGAIMTLATNQPAATSLCADGTNVYWNEVTNGGISAILKVPVGGGSPVTFFQESSGAPTSLTIDATNLYWTDRDSGSVVLQPLSGSVSTTVANGQDNPFAIGVQSGEVYWSTYKTSIKGWIMKWTPTGGGTITTLASTANSNDEVLALTVDANNVYWVSSGGNVEEVATNGAGTAVILLSNQKEALPTGISVDATDLYWATGSVGGSGGAQPDGTITRIPLAGGAPVTIAPEQISPGGVAVNATSVYWITSVPSGAVMRLSPK